MDIDIPDLKAQYQRANTSWPWLHSYEDFARFPYMTLFGVGSRETNLTNEVGDGGHGHGVWQEDDRWNVIPSGFDSDVQLQAQTAAEKLNKGYELFGAWLPTFAWYNSGQTSDWGTAHHDYAADVQARILTLQQLYPRVINGIRLLELTSPYMTGNDVKFLQAAWNAKHWQPPLTVDGVYGPLTAQAVKSWQSQHGLTPDGIVGPQTLAAMARAS